MKKVNARNGYRVYAEQAVQLGLDAGGLWKSLKDWPHVQRYKAGSPLGVWGIGEIDRKMATKFG